MASAGGHRVDFVRKGLIVALLFAGVLLLYRYAVPSSGGPDPTALLALGFVVLAAFAIGELVEVVKLPHITGYLLAGLVLGPSISHTFHLELPPPFDHGVLNPDVIRQLGILDALALPLICLTAGGALDLKEIRKAIRPIFGILVGQTIFIFAGCVTLFWLISGPLPFLTMPQLADLELPAILALGAVVASVSLATSDAATIAIVVSTRARGPLTTNALSVAVLKDVLVVICFSASTAIALSVLPTGTEASFVDALIGIGLSVVLGVALGVGIHFYLKYINAELLLFLVGMIYTMSFIADQLHAESALMFIIAGFIAANWSPFGEKLIKEVELLSTPVFVVFFTLAGAKLHLDVLAEMAAFGIALVVVRAGALYIGCRLGAIVGKADPMSKKYVWLSYLSQAGLAITLANGMPETYGESIGGALFSFLLAGVAIHELIGPAALQFALDKAGEISKGDKDVQESEDTEEAPMRPERWRPTPGADDDPWGLPPDVLATDLAKEVSVLEEAVKAEAERVIDGPLSQQRRSTERYLRDLRQAFLAEHRRLNMTRRRGSSMESAGREASLRLSEKWRRLAAARASGIATRAWDPQALIVRLDTLSEAAPDTQRVPIEPETFESRAEGRLRAIRRRVLHSSRRIRPLNRNVSVSSLARYHLGGRTPLRLESFAGTLIHAELRLTAASGDVFDDISDQLNTLGKEAEALEAIRRSVDAQLGALSQELSSHYDSGASALLVALGEAMRAIKSDLKVIGTLDLPSRKRRYNLVFQERNRGQQVLRERYVSAQTTARSAYAALQMRLELYSYAVKARATGRRFADVIEVRVRTESIAPLLSVARQLDAALQECESLIETAPNGSILIDLLQERAQPLMAQIDHAVRGASSLQLVMQGAEPVQPLLETLREQSQQLSADYTVPAGELDLSDGGALPVMEQTTVPLRSLALKAIDTEVTRQLLTITRKLGDELEVAVRQLEELHQIIPFNVDLACSELETYADAEIPGETRGVIREMVLGAIGRSQTRIQRLCERAVDWPDSTGIAISAAVDTELEALMALLHVGHGAELRQVLMRDEAVRRSLASRAEELGGVVSQAGRQLTRFAQRAIGPDRLADVRYHAGLPVEEAVPLRFALQAPEDISPTVYRRLFTGTHITTELMAGRASEMARLRSIFLSDGLRTAAVIGPRGAGSSSLSRLATRGQGRIRQVIFNRPVTEDDVARVFTDSSEGEVILIDGLQWLFSPLLDATAPLRRLIRGVLADKGRNAWIISADALVWDSACLREPLAEAFSTVVRLQPMSAGVLQDALLSRHAMSGYDVVYDQQDDVRWQWRILSGRSAQQAFFDGLHSASGGVTRDALRLWLASIKAVDDATAVVRVGTVPRPPRGRLSRLSDRILLTLRLVLRQGWVTPEIHARLFCTRLDESTALLARMKHDGLLRCEESDHYRLVPHLYTPIGDVLQQRGWL